MFVGWILLGLVTLALTTIYIYYKYVVFTFWRKRGVVYPEPNVPMGNVGPFARGKISVGELFEKYYKEFKEHRLFGTYTFFKPNLVIADPDLIRIVLASEFSSFHDRGMFCNEEIDPLTGHIFSLPGKKWRNLRVKLTPTFTSGKIRNMFQTLVETSDELMKYLDSRAEKRESIDVKDIFARFTTDVITSMVFGTSTNSLKNPDNEFRHWSKKVFEARPVANALVMFAPQFYEIFSIPYNNRGVTRFFTTIFQDTVEYREKHNIVRQDFLNLIIQMMKNGVLDADDGKEDFIDSKEPEKLTMLQGAAQSFVFLLAGYETSSTTVTHCLYELSLNQDIQMKVQHEIDMVLKKHNDFTYAAVNEMPYLQQVIYETLRKYPVLPILNRICTKDIILPTTDVHIPKGTLVTIPVLGLHRDPSIFPDPDKFDPERFTKENVAARHPYVFLPFGEGPRICIGMRFALVQVKLALACALSKFSFKPGPKTPIPLAFDVGNIVLMSKQEIQLVIERR